MAERKKVDSGLNEGFIKREYNPDDIIRARNYLAGNIRQQSDKLQPLRGHVQHTLFLLPQNPRRGVYFSHESGVVLVRGDFEKQLPAQSPHERNRFLHAYDPTTNPIPFSVFNGRPSRDNHGYGVTHFGEAVDVLNVLAYKHGEKLTGEMIYDTFNRIGAFQQGNFRQTEQEALLKQIHMQNPMANERYIGNFLTYLAPQLDLNIVHGAVYSGLYNR